MLYNEFKSNYPGVESMEHISDTIKDEYKEWGKYPTNKVIFINSGTGTGKTTFVLEKLLPFAYENKKRILFLCNRKSLQRQVEAYFDSENEHSKRIIYRDSIHIGLFQSYTSQMFRYDSILNRYGKLVYDAFIKSINSRADVIAFNIKNGDTLPRYKNVIADFSRPYLKNTILDFSKCANGVINPEYDYELMSEAMESAFENPGYRLYDGSVVDCFPANEAVYYRIFYRDNSVFAKCKKKKLLPLEYYDYVVMDEIHYLLQDSMFNFGTIDFLKMIMKKTADINNNRAMIFMSGTSSEMHRVFAEYIRSIFRTQPNLNFTEMPFYKEYTLPQKYDYISKNVFSSIEELVDIIADTGDKKWLIFIDTKRNGEKLCKMINEKYNCSENSPIKKAKFIYRYQYVKKDISDMEKYRYFDDVKCLIATSIIDNGISIEDEELEYMAVITWDEVEFLQMVGRKRRTENEVKNEKKLNLYVMNRANEEIDKYINNILVKRNRLLFDAQKASNDIINGDNEKFFSFVSNYCNDKRKFEELNGLVRFTNKGLEVNFLAFEKISLTTQKFMNLKYNIQNQTTTFADYQFELLGFKTDKPILDPIGDAIEKLLEENVGKKLDKDELADVKIKLNALIRKINNRSKLPIKNIRDKNSIDKTNEWLVGASFFYEIRIEIVNKNTKKRMYEIAKLTNDEFQERKRRYGLNPFNVFLTREYDDSSDVDNS